MAYEQEAAAGVHHAQTADTDPEIPRLKISVSIEISGDWVTPEVIAQTAHTLADTLAARLNVAADDPAFLVALPPEADH